MADDAIVKGALVLDRFVMGSGGRARDLATGSRVLIRRITSISVGEQRLRAQRCAERLDRLQRSGWRLIDFGAVSRDSWAEVFVRDGSTGFAGTDGSGRRDDPWRAGINDVLASCGPGDLRLLAARGSTAGLRGLLRVSGRIARRQGFVPCQIGLLADDPQLRSLVADRHLLLLAPAERGGPKWVEGAGSVLIDLSLAIARPRVILVLECDQNGPVEPVLRRFEPDATVSCTRRQEHRPLRVAELGGTYGSGRPSESTGVPVANRCMQDRARCLSARGRHSEASRVLRREMHRLARRGCDGESLACGMTLVGLIRARGRTSEALRLYHQMRQTAVQRHDAETNLRVAIEIGRSHVDEGRLYEGESVLRSAGVAAFELRYEALRGAASAALGRCLLWQGRFVEAEQALVVSETATGTSVELRCHAARLALARGDLGRAHAEAREARRLAWESVNPADRLKSRTVTVEAKASVGDVEGLEECLSEILSAGPRRALGLWDLRLRAIHVEGLQRGGRRADARVRAARLFRRARRSLPALLRARLLRAAALGLAGLPEGERAREELDAFVRTSGASLLRLPMDRHPSEAVAAGLLEVLKLCQESEDEEGGLERVCELARRRLQAVSVGLYTADPGSRPLAAAGSVPRQRPQIVDRVLETGLDLPVCHVSECAQAAAVVRSGSAPIAVLVSRWAVDAALNRAWIEGFLPACATACAPGVRTTLDRCAPVPAGAVPDLGLLGTSRQMADVRDAVARAAAVAFPVLILGESGSGKELVARAVHRVGLRARRPFCTLNCAAVADDLFEAELFGHARGAFTGAVAERPGVFEEADGGTLFLDEVGDLSPRAQAKLLRAIQYGEVRRVGENTPRRVDVRIVAATNRSLDEAAATGRFRTDLMYRLDVIRIVVPPLRERPQDIPDLVRHFWMRTTMQTGSRAQLDEATIAALVRYEWPGNVREIENVIAALAVRAPGRGRVRPSALPPLLLHAAGTTTGTLDVARRRFDQHFIAAALARAGGRRSRAAADLGVSRQGLVKLMRRLGLGVQAGPAGRTVPSG